jgi:hypothetical protein
MNFGDWLRAVDADIRFSDYKLHLAGVNPDKEDPHDLYRIGKFAEWQCLQTRRNFERPFVLAMIKTQAVNEWLFAGAFENLGLVPGEHITPFRYQLIERPVFKEFSGRAITRFQRPGRQPYLNCESWIDSIDLIQLTRDRLSLPAFPGYRRIEVSRPILRQIVEQSPEDWRTALSQVSGIYIARDQSTQQLYIGSATGVEGIWQRWSEYAVGDGGNVAFKSLFENGGSERLDELTFSLVETADFNATAGEIRLRESHWKRVLGTRVIGLNHN